MGDRLMELAEDCLSAFVWALGSLGMLGAVILFWPFLLLRRLATPTKENSRDD